ncbi:hypothetical protein C8J57DRAFT_1530124 [Mycena rebaudengoi]|nr:hypothetical protein C8J57DRAFT_1530124 [Mycena rebaudengoi]
MPLLRVLRETTPPTRNGRYAASTSDVYLHPQNYNVVPPPTRLDPPPRQLPQRSGFRTLYIFKTPPPFVAQHPRARAPDDSAVRPGYISDYAPAGIPTHSLVSAVSPLALDEDTFPFHLCRLHSGMKCFSALLAELRPPAWLQDAPRTALVCPLEADVGEAPHPAGPEDVRGERDDVYGGCG